MIKKIDYTILYLLFVIVVAQLVYLSFNEFWQDELYSIYHFQLVPFTTILFDYHTTNNHILYNFLCSIFLKANNLLSFSEVLEKPYLLRSLSGLFSLFSIVLLYRKSRKNYGKDAAYLIVFVLLTSVIFIDFCMQARGYSLGMLLVTLQVFTFHELRKGWYKDIGKICQLGVYSVLLMLLLPTNVYFLGAISIILFIDFIRALSGSSGNVNTKRIFLLNILHSIIILGLTGYYLWLQSMQPPNIYLDTFDIFHWPHLYQLFSIPYNFSHFRFLFWLLIFFILLLFHKRIHLFQKGQQEEILVFVGLFLLPLVFFFIHGPIIVQRIFVPLIPVFSIVTGLLFYNLFKSVNLRWFRLWQIGTIVCFLYGFFDTWKDTVEDNLRSETSMSLRHHYYLFNYNPLEATKLAMDLQQKTGLPIFVFDDFGERGIYFYFDAYRVNYQKSFPDKPIQAIYVTNNKWMADDWYSQRMVSFRKLIPDKYMYSVYVPE